MFGNILSYYSGPGGIRRGLIWQNGGKIQPEWKEPETEFFRGNINPGDLWGTFLYGGLQAIRRVTADTDPVTSTWTHTVNTNILYSKTKKVIKFNYEWDNLQNTPQNLVGASEWFSAPDHQISTDYIGTVFKTKINFNPFNYSSVIQKMPYITIYRQNAPQTTAGTLQQFSASWNGDNWNTAGYPFDAMAQWLGTGAIFSSEYCGFNNVLQNRPLSISSIDAWNISEEIMLLDPANPTASYPWRIAKQAVIDGYVSASAAPSYFRGAWTITVTDALFPSFAFYNLT